MRKAYDAPFLPMKMCNFASEKADKMDKAHFSLTHLTTALPRAEYVRDYRDTARFTSYCAQCGQYGRRWSCPPYDFDVEKRVEQYETVVIIGTKITFEKTLQQVYPTAQERNQISNDAMRYAGKVMQRQHEKWEAQYPGSYSFISANCFLCGDTPCARLEGKMCRHPERMRHSLESCGFDIGKTATSLLGIDLKWARGNELPEYLMLVTALFLPQSYMSNGDLSFDTPKID